MGSVPGNHDFWINSSPTLWTKKDQARGALPPSLPLSDLIYPQLANGFMQMYAQDVVASLQAEPTPYDFSRNPDSPAEATNIPPASDFFWFTPPSLSPP
jgi:hypothetical protein